MRVDVKSIMVRPVHTLILVCSRYFDNTSCKRALSFVRDINRVSQSLVS